MTASTPPLRFLRDRDGRRIAYAVHGRGPLLVCPAWWIGHLEWDWAQPESRRFFERLGQVATVVRYDRPGCGLSDAFDGERDLDDEVDLLDRIIRDVDLPVAALFGMSTGGPTAVAWAARHPNTVRRLVLYGTYARGEDIAPPPLRKALSELVLAHWGAGARALADVFIPDANAEQRDAFAALQRRATDAVTAERLLQLTYRADASHWLDRLDVETFVLHRTDDRAMPFSAGRALAAGIRGARLETFPGRDHPIWLCDEACDRVVQLLAELGSVAVSGEDRELGTASASRRRATAARGGCVLDEANCCLVIDEAPVALTPREFGLMRHLLRNAGRVVSRSELIETVWQQSTVGSNVVDTAVRSLRKKLGSWAASVETVVCHGYRFQEWRSDDERSG